MTGAGHIRALLLAGLALLLAPGGALSQSADDLPAVTRIEPVKRLRLMLLDLADLRLPGGLSAARVPTGTYHHTFGAERRSTEETLPPAIDPQRLEADIVVVHGITDAVAARRLFPARDWRLLFARSAAGAPQPPGGKPAAAVALWLQAGVKFAGADLSLAPGEGAAVRITSGLGGLWVLSSTEPCGEEQSKPHALCDRAETWLSSKVAAGEMAVLGGRLPTRAAIGSSATPWREPQWPAPTGTSPLAPRRQDRSIELSAADATRWCDGTGRDTPALHLRLGARSPALDLAGYVLPIDPPQAMSRPTAGAPPPRRKACALILDIGLAR